MPFSRHLEVKRRGKGSLGDDMCRFQHHEELSFNVDLWIDCLTLVVSLTNRLRFFCLRGVAALQGLTAV